MVSTTLVTGAGALSDYYDWFKVAAHGDLLVYHTGDLQFDRETNNVPLADAGRALALSALASRIMSDSSDGYLILTQKRVGVSRFEYRATRSKSPYEPAHT